MARRGGYHVLQFLIHLLAARPCSASSADSASTGAAGPLWPVGTVAGLTVAVLWLVHPLQTGIGDLRHPARRVVMGLCYL